LGRSDLGLDPAQRRPSPGQRSEPPLQAGTDEVVLEHDIAGCDPNRAEGGGRAEIASAAIVCSGNVCWHTHERYTYPPESKVIIHDDNWRWGPGEKYTFREHEGRGYWKGDTWTEW
jgi:hypothetical protein